MEAGLISPEIAVIRYLITLPIPIIMGLYFESRRKDGSNNTILSIIALILTIINYKKTGNHYEGLKSGLKQFIQTTPIILGAFVLCRFD